MSKKKGLNVSKVEEILDNEVVKDILNKKEEVEDMNNIEMREQAIQDMKETEMNNVIDMKETEMNNVIDMKEAVIEEGKKVIEECENMRLDILHYNIKKAIYISKGYGKRGINGKQLKSIQDSYFYATGCELSEERVNYLKTITDKQAEQVIIVLNKFHRYLRLQQSTSPVTNA